MDKRKKVITIVSISLVSALVGYLSLGLIGTAISGAVINRRYSDISTLENDFYRVQKVRRDFPSLANRDEITFKCREVDLMGYYYEATSPKGVIVFAHGINNLAEGNSAQMHNYFLNKNYDVFAIDMTGCGRSGGPGIKNLHESKHCVISAVNMIKNYEKSQDLPIFLIGHSWGGYGVTSATYTLTDISAVVSFSGYNVPTDMMYGFLETNTSKIMRITRPALNFGCALLYGNESFFPAEKAIQKNKDIPYIVIHGNKDTTVPFKDFSLFASVKDDNYPNVTTFELDNISHGGPWKTLEANNLTSKAQNDLKALKKQYNGDEFNEKREEYLSLLDLDATSEINEELLSYIDNTFTSLI